MERARDQLELEVSAMQARVQEEERECAEQARRARQLKEEVVDQMGRADCGGLWIRWGGQTMEGCNSLFLISLGASMFQCY